MRSFILSVLFFCSVTFSAFSGTDQISMRRCLLLPVLDSLDGAISYSIFENVENYLKDSSWCYYRSNSEIIDILKNYKKNIHVHLRNKEVLKLVAEKSNAGSLIRVDVKTGVGGSEVSMDIIGPNGEDVYFKEKETLKSDDVIVIAQTIKNWLVNYEKRIPYDGKVIGVLGNQFTIDTGNLYGIQEGDVVDIFRQKGKKRHPLLNEIVEWEMEQVAKAKIFHARKSISQGKVSEYASKKRLRIGDWIIHRKEMRRTKDDAGAQGVSYPDRMGHEFGKLGTVGVFFSVGTGSISISDNEVLTRKMGGALVGALLDLEVWATRNYWAGLSVRKLFGSFKKKEGTFSNEKSSVDTGVYRVKAGYRYLPIGFFYGPRVDAFIGYAKYSYGPDASPGDGVTAASFKGLMLGAQGNMPLVRDIRVFLEMDFLITSKYTEDKVVHGEDDSSTNYHVEIGGNYTLNPTMTFESALGYISNKAKFKSPTKEYSFKDTSFRVGVIFSF